MEESPSGNHVAPAAGRDLEVTEHAGLTDVGRERAGNEDSFLDRSPLFVVADGMGGAEAGEVASGATVDAFEEAFDAGDMPGSLGATLEAANATIYGMAQDDPSKRGMGCTCTAAWAAGGRLTVAHVGDSRLYRLREGELEQLTDDHSLVAGLVRLGQLTAAEAEHHPQRSVILRAVGVEPEVEVDLLELDMEEGDLYLVCSDGLSGMVREPVIAETLRMFPSLPEAVEMLIELANTAGGRDNITAVLFRVAAA